MRASTYPKHEPMKRRFMVKIPYIDDIEDMHFRDDRTEHGKTKREMLAKTHDGHKPRWKSVRNLKKRTKKSYKQARLDHEAI